MNIFGRMLTASRFLFTGKVGYEILPAQFREGQPVYTKPNLINNTRKYYTQNEVMFACVSLKADSCSLPKLVVHKENGDIAENHPLQKIIDNPNPHMTEFDMLTLAVTLLEICGTVYFEKVRSKAGRVVQLWPLRPDWVKPVPSAKNFIMGYEYWPPGAKKVFIPAEDIIPFTTFHPLNPYKALAPMSVASKTGDVDNSNTDFLKLFFEQGGMPPGYLKTKQALNDIQVADIRNRWKERYGGFRNWFEPAVLSFDADYVRLGLTFEEMGSEHLDARSVERICMVFKVPPILIGSRLGMKRSTFNNFQSSRLAFWQDGMLPLLKRIKNKLNGNLANEFPGFKYEWDYSAVAVLNEDAKSLWARAGSSYSLGGITLNEYRQMIGFDKVGGGDLFLKRPSSTDGEANKKYLELSQALASQRWIEPAALSTTGDYVRLSDCGHLGIREYKQVGESPDQDERTKREDKTKRAVLRFFRGQQERVLDEVNAQTQVQFRAFVAACKKEEKFDNPFWDNEREQLYAVLFPEVLESARIGAKTALDDLVSQTGAGVDWALVNNAAVEWAKDYTFDLVKGITGTTRAGITAAFDAWVESGQPLSALTEQIAPLFGDVRAEMIAVTETTRAFFEGNRQSWLSSGIVSGWIWRTAFDERVCPICGSRAEEFFPLDSAEVPPAHVRCRCWAVPEIMTQQEAA